MPPRFKKQGHIRQLRHILFIERLKRCRDGAKRTRSDGCGLCLTRLGLGLLPPTTGHLGLPRGASSQFQQDALGSTSSAHSAAETSLARTTVKISGNKSTLLFVRANQFELGTAIHLHLPYQNTMHLATSNEAAALQPRSVHTLWIPQTEK